uniref:uncharacterized protein LOC120341203 n=1 Tax=Styela clava TaxID=7725 RepID=UPI00193987A5|nr:uncharacterized protein LOC120341203 [Styela clava]
MNIRTGQTRSEKISFFVYLLNLLTCAILWSILLAWEIISQLIEYDVIGRDEFDGIFKRSDVTLNISSIRLNVGDASSIFLVVYSIVQETILVIGICGAIRVHRQRILLDGSPDTLAEPKTSVYFVIFLRISIVICLVLGGMTLSVNGPLASHMSSAMSSVITGSTESTSIYPMDIYQSMFQCCGANSPKDWIEVDEDNGIIYNRTPQSCCINSSDCSKSPIHVFDDIPSTAAPISTANPGVYTSVPISFENDYTFDIIQTQIYDRGCDSVIQSFLIIHSILLLASATILILLHASWFIWRRNAGFPYMCCESFSGRNRVQPINLNVNDGSTSSNESLVFLENKLIKNISSSESVQLFNVPESLENSHIIFKKPAPLPLTRVAQDMTFPPIDPPLSSFTNENEKKYRPRKSRGRPKTGISRSTGSLSLRNLTNDVAKILGGTMSGHRPPTPAEMPSQTMIVHGDIDIEAPVTLEPALLHFSGPSSSKDKWATAVNLEVPNTKRQNEDDKLSIYSCESLEGW